MTSDKVLEVWGYLAEQADHYVDHSGVKEEFRSLVYAGYCVALDHIAYALNLPVDSDGLIETTTPALIRIRERFPVGK